MRRSPHRQRRDPATARRSGTASGESADAGPPSRPGGFWGCPPAPLPPAGHPPPTAESHMVPPPGGVRGGRDQTRNGGGERVTRAQKRVGGVIVAGGQRRFDLPQDVSESVYRRMEAERKRIANELRSTGFAEAERIRADADRQREVILAVAYRDAQRVRGEGDAKAANIYAQAFSQNPEFFSFYRSMEAYRSTFRGRNDLMLLEPNSDFFRYLKDAFGRQSTRK